MTTTPTDNLGRRGAPNRSFEPTQAARMAGLVVEGRVASMEGSTTFVEVLDVLRRPPEFAAATILLDNPYVPLHVGDVAFLFLTNGAAGRLVYLTFSRTVAERLVARLPPSEPMPSLETLQALADSCDLLIRGLAHPHTPTSATLEVLSVLDSSAAGRAALGSDAQPSIEIAIAAPADGSAAGGWHWTFDVGPEAQRIGVIGHYLLGTADNDWLILNPIHPTLLTTAIVSELRRHPSSA